MSNAFIVEINEATAGIAVRERSGFRFYASTPQFWPMDDTTFPSFKAVQSAAARIKQQRPSAADGPRRFSISG